MELRSGKKFGKGMPTTITVGDSLRVAENYLDGRGSFELLFSPILVPDLNCDCLLKAVNEGRERDRGGKPNEQRPFSDVGFRCEISWCTDAPIKVPLRSIPTETEQYLNTRHDPRIYCQMSKIDASGRCEQSDCLAAN